MDFFLLRFKSNLSLWFGHNSLHVISSDQFFPCIKVYLHKIIRIVCVTPESLCPKKPCYLFRGTLKFTHKSLSLYFDLVLPIFNKGLGLVDVQNSTKVRLF